MLINATGSAVDSDNGSKKEVVILERLKSSKDQMDFSSSHLSQGSLCSQQHDLFSLS